MLVKLIKENLFTIIIVIAAGLFYSYYQNIYMKEKLEERSEKKRQADYKCSISPTCLDKKAKWKSELGNKTIVRSGTGRYFFSGKPCIGNCSGHIAGYDWADEKSLSKPALHEEDCTSNSKSFTEGCLIFIEDYHYDLCHDNIGPFPDGYDFSDLCDGYYGY